MTVTQTREGAHSVELEAIADAAAARLQAEVNADDAGRDAAQARVAQAAGAAIAAGAPLGAIADAERAGEARAREGLSSDVLRRIKRAAQRKTEVEREYAEAIRVAGRAGLAQRDIATAAGVSQAAVRTVLTRGDEGATHESAAGVPAAEHSSETEA